MQHLTVQANGAAFHVARTGTGQPLLLLHGWPEFWLSWEQVTDRFQCASGVTGICYFDRAAVSAKSSDTAFALTICSYIARASP